MRACRGWAERERAAWPAGLVRRCPSKRRWSTELPHPKCEGVGSVPDHHPKPDRASLRQAATMQCRAAGVTPANEAVDDDAATVVAAIAHRIERELSDVAKVDILFKSGSLSDLTVLPHAVGAAPISLVGLRNGFVLQTPRHRWEIQNTASGRAELEQLLSSIVAGRIGRGRRSQKATAVYKPYRST